MNKPWIPKVGEKWWRLTSHGVRQPLEVYGELSRSTTDDASFYAIALHYGGVGGLFSTKEAAQSHADKLNAQIKEWTTPKRFVYEECSFENATSVGANGAKLIRVPNGKIYGYAQEYDGNLMDGECWVRLVKEQEK